MKDINQQKYGNQVHGCKNKSLISRLTVAEGKYVKLRKKEILLQRGKWKCKPDGEVYTVLVCDLAVHHIATLDNAVRQETSTPVPTFETSNLRVRKFDDMSQTRGTSPVSGIFVISTPVQREHRIEELSQRPQPSG